MYVLVFSKPFCHCFYFNTDSSYLGSSFAVEELLKPKVED